MREVRGNAPRSRGRIGTNVLSVIIPTRNRAGLLRESLTSLGKQTINHQEFEVIVIDDGSTDHTADVCKEFSSKMDLKYRRIMPSGIAAAKNVGIFTSRGSILMFFDDDDLADPDLCRQHLEAHSRYPQYNLAILGYTDWAPSLNVTLLMHFLTEVGQFLFSYASMHDGQTLDWTGFWGGRTSCKRRFLIKHGVFHQDFTFGYEDDELGYRLSKYGLEVIFNRKAVQHMNRAYTFDEFCRRCEREGFSQWRFSQLHSDPIIQEYCQVIDAQRRWQDAQTQLPEKIRRVRQLETQLKGFLACSTRQELEHELMGHYDWTFKAFKLKGATDAMNAETDAAARRRA
jgi:glycosyltransferase involved in cell wall biosynthesis